MITSDVNPNMSPAYRHSIAFPTHRTRTSIPVVDVRSVSGPNESAHDTCGYSKTEPNIDTFL